MYNVFQFFWILKISLVKYKIQGWKIRFSGVRM